MSTDSLIEKLQGKLQTQMRDGQIYEYPCDYNAGIKDAIAIICQHTAAPDVVLKKKLESMFCPKCKESPCVCQSEIPYIGNERFVELPQSLMDMAEKIAAPKPVPKDEIRLLNDEGAVKTMLAACEGLEDLEDCMRAAYHALDNAEYLKAPVPVSKDEIRLPFKPTEAMCDEARGFIMGLDLGVRKWRAMQGHLAAGGYSSLPYIMEQCANNPDGHITKWDVADCIWQLMARALPVPTPEPVSKVDSAVTLDLPTKNDPANGDSIAYEEGDRAAVRSEQPDDSALKTAIIFDLDEYAKDGSIGLETAVAIINKHITERESVAPVDCQKCGFSELGYYCTNCGHAIGADNQIEVGKS